MLTRPPSLGAVAAFEAAARHESFAKAADELNLTRSAISHAVRALEQRLGARLFRRAGRQVALTEEGALLATRVRASLALLGEALDRRPLLAPRQLSIGVDPTLGARLLAPRLAAFRERHRDIAVELSSAAGAAALAAAEVDVWLQAGAQAPPGFAGRALADERLAPVAAPGFAAGCDLAAAGAERLIESREHPWSLWFSGLPRKQPIGPPAAVVDTDGVAIALACGGLGVCLAPLRLVEDDLARRRLVRLTRRDVPSGSGYHVCWRPASARLDQIALFAAWLAEALAAVPAGEPTEAWSA